MVPNTFVLALVPSSTRLKEPSGEGEAVKRKLVEPLGVASLMTVIEAGKITASADREWSWLPPDPSRSISRVWYGEPEIETAELFAPHWERDAMCPPQASTASAEEAVKVIVIARDLSPVGNPAPPE